MALEGAGRSENGWESGDAGRHRGSEQTAH